MNCYVEQENICKGIIYIYQKLIQYDSIPIQPMRQNSNIILYQIQTQMVKQFDKTIYQLIMQDYRVQQTKEINHKLAFLPHFMVKAVVLAFYMLINYIKMLIGQAPTDQLIVVFIVIDFWLTKNVNGRKMIGIRWFFENDQYGVERFKFQCRANPQINSSVNARLFWIIQVVYALLPALFVVTAFLIVPNLDAVSRETLVLNLAIVGSSLSNIFFFYKASEASGARQEMLRNEMGLQFVRKMQYATIISYA